MPTIDDAKATAERLRSALATNAIDISHAMSLELVAAELGHRDWNTAAIGATLSGRPAAQHVADYWKKQPFRFALNSATRQF